MVVVQHVILRTEHLLEMQVGTLHEGSKAYAVPAVYQFNVGPHRRLPQRRDTPGANH